jgi:hypothetical protein
VAVREIRPARLIARTPKRNERPQGRSRYAKNRVRTTAWRRKFFETAKRRAVRFQARTTVSAEVETTRRGAGLAGRSEAADAGPAAASAAAQETKAAATAAPRREHG